MNWYSASFELSQSMSDVSSVSSSQIRIELLSDRWSLVLILFKCNVGPIADNASASMPAKGATTSGEPIGKTATHQAILVFSSAPRDGRKSGKSRREKVDSMAIGYFVNSSR